MNLCVCFLSPRDLCSNVVFLFIESKDCVVIREDGRGVDYKSGKDEVKHSNLLLALINMLQFAFSKLSLLVLCFFQSGVKVLFL